MKGKRYSQEQKVYGLKLEAGKQVVEVCRQLEVSVATFYQWKRTLGSMGISERVRAERPLPESITVNNGGEFAGRAFDAWAYLHRVKLDFIRHGKPVENASSRASTESCVTSASTQRSPSASQTQAKSLSSGIITIFVRTAPRQIGLRPILPGSHAATKKPTV